MRALILLLALASCGGEPPTSPGDPCEVGEPCRFEPADCTWTDACFRCTCRLGGWAEEFVGCIDSKGDECGPWSYLTSGGDTCLFDNGACAP